MGNKASAEAPAAAEALDTNVPDASLSSNITTAEENERKKKLYANLKSAAASQSGGFFRTSASSTPSENVIEQVYNEDFETIDHIQAMRFPPYVAKQIKDAVRNECERRCAEKEKTMARCLQDKMWTSWKCQKERDAYYYCVEDEEKRNTNPRHPDEELEGVKAQPPLAYEDKVDPMMKQPSTQQIGSTVTAPAPPPDPENFVDLLTAYRWKFNLGVLHGEIIGRNNIMRQVWKDHFPDRELPHPWVKDEE